MPPCTDWQQWDLLAWVVLRCLEKVLKSFAMPKYTGHNVSEVHQTHCVRYRRNIGYLFSLKMYSVGKRPTLGALKVKRLKAETSAKVP